MSVVVSDQVYDAVAALHVDGADVLGAKVSEPAALDHGRTTHPDVGVRCRDQDVARAGQGRVARETAPRHDGDHGHPPAQRRHGAEGSQLEARPGAGVGVTGATTAAFREQHYRNSLAIGDLEQAVGLGVIAHALGTGQHRVVVRDHDALAAADGRHSADQSVGGCVGDQVFLAASTALRCQRESAVLDQAVVVDQVVDVLASSPASQLVALGHSCGPRRVQGHLVASDDLREIGADVVEVHLVDLGELRARACATNDEQWFARSDRSSR